MCRTTQWIDWSLNRFDCLNKKVHRTAARGHWLNYLVQKGTNKLLFWQFFFLGECKEHSFCQARPTGPFPFSMCCWRTSQEGFTLQDSCRDPISGCPGKCSYVGKKESHEAWEVCDTRHIVEVSCSPVCVQKKMQALCFLWESNLGIQALVPSFLSTLLVLLRQKTGLHLLWTPFFVLLSATKNSHCSQWAAIARCLILSVGVFRMVSTVQNPWLHLCFQKWQRRRPAPTSREKQSCLLVFLSNIGEFSNTTVDSSKQTAEARTHMESVLSATLNSFTNGVFSPVPWKSLEHRDASLSFEHPSYLTKGLQLLRKRSCIIIVTYIYSYIRLGVTYENIRKNTWCGVCIYVYIYM